MLLGATEKTNQNIDRKGTMPTNDHNKFDPTTRTMIVASVAAFIIGMGVLFFTYDSPWWGHTDVETGHLASWLLAIAAVVLTLFGTFFTAIAINRRRSRRTRPKYKPIRKAGSFR